MSVDGWDSYPAWRGEDVVVSNMHGKWVNNRRFSNSRSLIIPMIILPYDPVTGAQTNSVGEHLQENLDTLLGLLYSGVYDSIGLVRTMPDATVRTIKGEVIDAIDVGGGTGYKELSLQFDCPYPFWHGGAVSEPTKSGAFTVTNDGNAPVGDAVFTFSGAATLTNDATGDSFEIVSGANTIVDAGARTIKRSGSHVDEDFTLGDTGYWIELVPGVNNLTLTGAGTVDIDFFDGWL